MDEQERTLEIVEDQEDGKVNLTPTEWMSLIDKTGDGLGICCANISALRDEIIDIARNGGEVDIFNGPNFLKTYRAAADGHDLSDLVALVNLVTQVERLIGQKADEIEHKLLILPRMREERERQRQS